MLPADHPDIGHSLTNLAEGYAAVGDAEKALPLYVEALELCRFRHPLGNSDIHWVDPVIECLGVVSSFT